MNAFVSAAQRKVRFDTAAVNAFRAVWPCAELRSRSYWFQFDASGDLVDVDVPEHDDGTAAAALADDAKALLFDGTTPNWFSGTVTEESAA